jgi:hypothetical protein
MQHEVGRFPPTARRSALDRVCGRDDKLGGRRLSASAALEAPREAHFLDSLSAFGHDYRCPPIRTAARRCQLFSERFLGGRQHGPLWPKPNLPS